MVCFLAGELNNNAHYFSTFANVNTKICNDYKKRIGDGKNDWIITVIVNIILPY